MFERRLNLLRALMDERGYDAAVLRNVADIRWLTGAARVFDNETAHTAFITADSALLHTDSRYFGALVSALGADSEWVVDQETTLHPQWVAQKVASCKARVVAVEDTITLGWFERLEAELGRASMACLLPRMHDDVARMRIVKDESELDILRRAQAVTDAAFTHMVAYVRAGLSELAVRAELEGYMLSHGADALAFDSIIATGPNGANPHARPSSAVLAEGDMVVMDFGASLMDYQSDMTRTICVGTPGDEQRRVYDVVRKAHEEAARAAYPGILGKDLHNVAARVIEESGYGDYFKHGLGHGVGIDIHELPNASIRGDAPLVEGSVFTIEPGVYLPGKFGVRLEDCGVMGPNGYDPFTQSTHDLVCV